MNWSKDILWTLGSHLRSRHRGRDFEVAAGDQGLTVRLGQELRFVPFDRWDEYETIRDLMWMADDLAGWHRVHVPFRIGQRRLRGYAGHHRQLKSTLPPEFSAA